jgi:L,D-peptidoglycan transpeptidase YkuD (ErfK/YbiS/YcfS/YnhG family)
MRRRALLAVALLGLAYVGFLAASAAWAQTSVAHESCPPEGAVIQVDTNARVLCLCRSGYEDAVFRVALGRRGVDKTREGDARTPRGRYSLSPATSSARYHLFLPVGYPTPEQVDRGFTGSAIGVHGPHIAFAWLGHSTTWIDWTLGCIAVGTRSQVEHLARWVADNGVREIVIL